MSKDVGRTGFKDRSGVHVKFQILTRHRSENGEQETECLSLDLLSYWTYAFWSCWHVWTEFNIIKLDEDTKGVSY